MMRRQDEGTAVRNTKINEEETKISEEGEEKVRGYPKTMRTQTKVLDCETRVDEDNRRQQYGHMFLGYGRSSFAISWEDNNTRTRNNLSTQQPSQ